MHRPIVRPNLDDAIKRHGMSKSGFAYLCSVNNATVTGWLRDPSQAPTKNHRIKAGQLLGVPEELLFRVEEVM